MVEVPKKDFKSMLKLLKIQRDMFEDVANDKKNNFVKRKTAREGAKLADQLLGKYGI